jgi:hypothetical protein
MDSAAAELALILGALYLLDCFRWVARPARLFRRWPFLGTRLERPMRIAAQLRRSLAVGLPLPLEQLFSVEGGCLRPLAEGLWVSDAELSSWTRPGRSATVISWNEVPALRVRGLELSRGSTVVHAFGSRRAAAAVASELERLSAAKGEGARAQVAEASFLPRFDVEALEARMLQWSTRGPWLKVPATLLLGSIVALLGAMLEGELTWWLSVPPVLLGWVWSVVAAVVVIRRALPAEVRPSRGQWALLFLSPLSLIRAADLVEAELLADFEPLAVAAALLEKSDAERVVKEGLRGLAHPLVYDDEPHLDDGPLRARMARLLEQLAAARGLSVTAVPPAGRHCPRCLTEYRAELQRCASCPGVELVG